MTKLIRTVATLLALTLVAAACGDDSEAQTVADEIVDDLISDPPEPAPTDPPEPAPTDPPEPAPTDPPEPAPTDPPAPALQVTQACLVLRHYSSGLFVSPYEAFIIFDTEGDEPVDIDVTHDDEFDASVSPAGDGFPAGGIVTWPVFAPGPVSLPTSIVINGEEQIETIVGTHLDGTTEFIAASAEIRDEEIVPVPCPIDYFVIPEGFDS